MDQISMNPESTAMCGAKLLLFAEITLLRHVGPQEIPGKIQTNHFPAPHIAVLS